MLVGGVTVTPDVCPQLTPGATVRLVCTLSSPLPGAGLTVEWFGHGLGYLHTARLVVLLRWGLSKGILVVPCGRGPEALGGRQADPWEGWIHRSTALVICAVQVSSVTGTGSLWNFGWEREMVPASAFVPPLS